LRLLQEHHGGVQLPRPAAACHRCAERHQVVATATVAGATEQLQGSLPLEAEATGTWKIWEVKGEEMGRTCDWKMIEMR